MIHEYPDPEETMPGLFRLIVIAAVIWLVYRLLKRGLDKLSSAKKTQQADQAIGNMVRCRHCGLHIPEAEAIKAGDRYYCSKQHLKQDRH